MRFATIVLCAVLLGGCANEVGGAEAEPLTCSGSAASPLSAEVVLDALRDEGLSMEASEESELCAIEDVVADFTNGERHGDSEGYVGCTIRREPLRSSSLQVDLDAPAAYPIFSGDKAELWLANVECTIYPEGDDKAGQVERLRRALEKLEATL